MSKRSIHPAPSLPTSPISKRTRAFADEPNPLDVAMDMSNDPTPQSQPAPISFTPITNSSDMNMDLDHDIHRAHVPTPHTNRNTVPTPPLHSEQAAGLAPETTIAAGPQNSAPTVQLIMQEERLLATSPLQVARLSERARLPTRGSRLAAGYDLYCAKTTTIPPGGRALIPTDLAIAVPPGTYGRVAPRSGLSVKKGLTIGAGVIDADYRGHVMVLVFNQCDVSRGEGDVVVEERERCAQLVLERCMGADVVDVTVPGNAQVVGGELEMGRAAGLVGTERGSGGFGSTG